MFLIMFEKSDKPPKFWKTSEKLEKPFRKTVNFQGKKQTSRKIQKHIQDIQKAWNIPGSFGSHPENLDSFSKSSKHLSGYLDIWQISRKFRELARNSGSLPGKSGAFRIGSSGNYGKLLRMFRELTRESRNLSKSLIKPPGNYGEHSKEV